MMTLTNKILVIADEYDACFGNGAFTEDLGVLPWYFNARTARVWRNNAKTAQLAIEQGIRA